ncbi:MAG: stage II sporulation protein M [Firmicutes bacterium]|jgi:stage II sporulation protein M|nr:stage II sporulation protein M [Bacillota bacterium]
MRHLPVARVLKDNKKWIVLSAIIFAIGFFTIFVGQEISGTDPLEDTNRELLGQLEELVEIISNSSPIVGVWLIFINNAISSLQMLALGIFLGLSPLLTLLVNGALLGALSAQVIQEGSSVWFLVAGILPHGLPELAAVFLCAALGLKIGIHATISPLPGMTRLESIKYIWKEIMAIIPLVIILLLLAALIEIFVTQTLIFKLLN